MRNIKNSYFRAILEATSNGKFPEYSDLWRCYHPFACMFDSDYSLFTELRFFSRADSLLFSSEPESSSAVFEVSREERSGAPQNRPSELYVPVTRKVIPVARKNPQNLHCKVSSRSRKNSSFLTSKVVLVSGNKSRKFH